MPVASPVRSPRKVGAPHPSTPMGSALYPGDFLNQSDNPLLEGVRWLEIGVDRPVPCDRGDQPPAVFSRAVVEQSCRMLVPLADQEVFGRRVPRP